MMVNLVVIVMLPAIFLSSVSSTSQEHNLIQELNEAKLYVARLESSLLEVNNNLKDKDNYLSKLETRILDLEKARNIQEASISSMKEEHLLAENKIIALEEEARQLWATLRKNNFDLHVLESKVHESEERLKALSSRTETMQAVVNEQWAQIQQFEQALLLGEMRLAKVQRQMRSLRCTFLKHMNRFSDNYLPKGRQIFNSVFWAEGSALRSFLSQTSDQLQSLFASLKRFHHKLQGIVKVEMERHELTAKLANEEIVFFVASALIVFPILSAWIWLSSQMH